MQVQTEARPPPAEDSQVKNYTCTSHTGRKRSISLRSVILCVVIRINVNYVFGSGFTC